MILHATERGAGGGPPLVLLHGVFGRSANFASVAQRLAEGRRVLALDLRNHGVSPHAKSMDYPAMAADVTETLAALDALPCVAVGHSMGGKVAMAMALAEPGTVARLLVADMAPVAYPPHFRVIVAALRNLALPPGLTRAAASAALADSIPDPATRAFLLQNLRVGADPGWTIGLDEIAAALPQIGAWPEFAGRYDGPTLFLYGARSDYVRPEHHAAIRALFPQAAFAALPTSHWVHAEDPDGFVAAVAAFAGHSTFAEGPTTAA